MRHLTASLTLPPEFGAAAASVPFTALQQLGTNVGISVCRIRSRSEALADEEIGTFFLEDGDTLIGDRARLPFRQPARDSIPRKSSAKRPLSGIKVVEATSRIQGPLAGQLLRMLGADITRVEPPDGDPLRFLPPLVGEAGAPFLAFNRGKRPVTLDLAGKAGRSELLDLLEGADVFLNNWRPGKAEQWDLDFKTLEPSFPTMVFAHASAWGRVAGPSRLTGTEYIVQAYSGLADCIAQKGDSVRGTRLVVADFFGGLLACEMVLRGLLKRAATGRGCFVESSLLEGAVMVARDAFNAINEKVSNLPLLQTSDGFLAVGGLKSSASRSIQEILGVEASDGFPRRELLRGNMKELAALLMDEGIPASPVCTDLRELTEDPEIQRVLEQHAGKAWFAGSPWTFSS